MKLETKFNIGQTVWKLDLDEVSKFIIGEMEIHIGVGDNVMQYCFPKIRAPKNQDDRTWVGNLYKTRKEASDVAIKYIENESRNRINNLRRE